MTAKKKCKKKQARLQREEEEVQAASGSYSGPGPLVRATVSWPAGEVDLHAFDASREPDAVGLPLHVNPGPVASRAFPNAVHSTATSSNGGSESFTDNIFVIGGSANREFATSACFYDNANRHVHRRQSPGAEPVDFRSIGLAGEGQR